MAKAKAVTGSLFTLGGGAQLVGFGSPMPADNPFRSFRLISPCALLLLRELDVKSSVSESWDNQTYYLGTQHRGSRNVTDALMFPGRESEALNLGCFWYVFLLFCFVWKRVVWVFCLFGGGVQEVRDCFRKLKSKPLVEDLIWSQHPAQVFRYLINNRLLKPFP